MTLIKDALYVTPRGELLKYLYENHFEFIASLKLNMYSENIQPNQLVFYMGPTETLVPYIEYKIKEQIREFLDDPS